jgi:hypothetical protein
MQALQLTLYDYETSWKRYVTILEQEFQALFRALSPRCIAKSRPVSACPCDTRQLPPLSYVVNETHNHNDHQFYRDLGRLVKQSSFLQTLLRALAHWA